LNPRDRNKQTNPKDEEHIDRIAFEKKIKVPRETQLWE
jgi:hypothetical protein